MKKKLKKEMITAILTALANGCGFSDSHGVQGASQCALFLHAANDAFISQNMTNFEKDFEIAKKFLEGLNK